MTQTDNQWVASPEAVENAVADAAGQAGATVKAVTAQARDHFALASTMGADGSQFMLNSFKAGADAFTASMETSFGKASAGLTDLNVKAVDVLRENVNSSFELWEQMIGARTLNQILELQADHARKRVERLSEQGQALSSLAQKVAYDSLEPLRSGFVKAAA